jgi:pimeloyl-ACP methyl ester carboxylesterase
LAELGFRVIAVDRPGQGWSDRPDGEADAEPARQAKLIRGALSAIGIDHAIVLGHSLGGAVAAAFALDEADFTDGLVLLGPVLYPWSTGLAWYYGPAASESLGPVFTRLVTLPAGLLLAPAAIQEVFAPQAAPPDYAARTGLALVFRPAAFMANAQDVARLLDAVTRQAPRMPQITAPVAIVTGEADRVVDPWIHSVHAVRDIRGARLTLLPDVGHSPHWTARDSVLAAVLDVAARLRSRAAPVASSP